MADSMDRAKRERRLQDSDKARRRRETAEEAMERRLLERGWQKGADGLFDPDLGQRRVQV
jgi:hypothetical protein